MKKETRKQVMQVPMPKVGKGEKKHITVNYYPVRLADTPEEQRALAFKRYSETITPDTVGSDECSQLVDIVYHQRRYDGSMRTLPQFRTGAELEGAIDAYWHFLSKFAEAGKFIVPDVEGMASYLGVSRQTLMMWKKGERNNEFPAVLDKAFNDIAMVKNQMAMRGQIPPLVYLSHMNNNHGYVSNSKIELDVGVRETKSEEALIAEVNLLPED